MLLQYTGLNNTLHIHVLNESIQLIPCIYDLQYIDIHTCKRKKISH